MMKEITNKELVEYVNDLALFQKREQEYFEKTGKKLFTGKFQIAYAINKARHSMEQALKPYHETIKEILEECNSEEAKKKGSIKIREDKMELWKTSLDQLQGEKTEIEIRTVKLADLECLDLDSTDLSCLEFMIE